MLPEKTEEVKESPEQLVEPEGEDSIVDAEDQSSEEDFVPKVDEESESEEKSEEEGEPLSTEEVATPKEDDDLEQLEVSDFEEKEKKSGVQKRIDKMTAELKSLREENAEIKKTIKPPETGSKKYSRQTLVKALEDGIEKGDSNLVLEVVEHLVTNAKDELRTEYQTEQQKASTVNEENIKEWNSVVTDYSYLWDEDEPEMYRGARKELDLTNKDSLLLQLSRQLFADPSNKTKYLVRGGQRVAVSDALAKILRKRKLSPKSKETDLLKKRLAKEKRKSALGGGKSSEREKGQPKPLSAKQSLDEYIADRKKAQRVLI